MDFSQRILIHSTFKQILIKHLLCACPNDPLNMMLFFTFALPYLAFLALQGKKGSGRALFISVGDEQLILVIE